LVEDVNADESQQPQRHEDSQGVNNRISIERNLEYCISEWLEGMLSWL
jgi:hypothetical protein